MVNPRLTKEAVHKLRIAQNPPPKSKRLYQRPTLDLHLGRGPVPRAEPAMPGGAGAAGKEQNQSGLSQLRRPPRGPLRAPEKVDYSCVR